MVNPKKILAGGVGVLLILLGVGIARKRYLQAAARGAFNSADKHQKPSWYAVRLKKAMEYDSSTGHTDEELIVDTLAAVPTREVWDEIKAKYSTLADAGTVSNLIEDLDSDLDDSEYQIASAIFESYPKDQAAAQKRWTDPKADDIRLAMRGYAARIYFYMHRGEHWLDNITQIYYYNHDLVDDEYWAKALQAWKEIPLASYAPHLSSAYYQLFNESLYGTLLDYLSDDQFSELAQTLLNKTDGKGKTIQQILTGS